MLAALWLAREDAARASDRPPFKVLAEPTMVDVARRRPRDAAELERMPGITPSVMRRMGEAILGAVGAGEDEVGS